MDRLAAVLFAVGFLIFGILAMVRPDLLLHWGEDPHPESADAGADALLLLAVRFVGALFLGFALFFSVIVAFSFTL